MELQLLWFHATTRQSLQGVKSEQPTAVRFTRRNEGICGLLYIVQHYPSPLYSILLVLGCRLLYFLLNACIEFVLYFFVFA